MGELVDVLSVLVEFEFLLLYVEVFVVIEIGDYVVVICVYEKVFVENFCDEDVCVGLG